MGTIHDKNRNNNDFTISQHIEILRKNSNLLEFFGDLILDTAEKKEDYLKAKSLFLEAWKLYNGERLFKKIKTTEFWVNIKEGDELLNFSNYMNALRKYNTALIIAEKENNYNLINISENKVNLTKKEIERKQREEYQEKLRQQRYEYQQRLYWQRIEFERRMEEERKRRIYLQRQRELNEKREKE
jgi:hypothetical protein